jgi:hypothetical protein
MLACPRQVAGRLPEEGSMTKVYKSFYLLREMKFIYIL